MRNDPVGVARGTDAVGQRALQAPSLFSGSGAPSDSIGRDGDSYYDPTAKIMYGPKSGGSWPAGSSLVGATGATGPVAWNDIRLGATISTTSTTLVDATGFSFSATANTSYALEWDIAWQGSIVNGAIGLSLNGPASPTLVSLNWETYNGTAIFRRNINAWNGGDDVGGSLLSLGTPVTRAFMQGIFRTGANAGTVIGRYKAGGIILNQVSLLAHSCMRWRVIA